MRIAMFTEGYLPYISGVVTYVKILRDELVRAGHEVLIVAACPKKLRLPEETQDVMYCSSIPMKRLYGYGVTNPLNLKSYKRIAEFNPDLIHIHTEFSIGLLGLYSARWLNVPVVYTLHTMYDDYLGYITSKRFEHVMKSATHLYLRNIASRATEITVPSDKVVRYLRHFGVNRHVNLVPNTAATRDFLPENNPSEFVARARNHMGLEDDDIAILFVGRLGFEKSIDVLIDGFVMACHDKPRFKLVILGDGPEADKLKEHAAQTPIADRIIFTGKVEYKNISAYYNASSLFCTASTSETNSITIYEATAAGLYVFQKLDRFNIGQITTGLTGDIFENNEEFCKLIDWYWNMSDDERARLRENVTISSRVYNEEVFCERMLNVYNIATTKHKEKASFNPIKRLIGR